MHQQQLMLSNPQQNLQWQKRGDAMPDSYTPLKRALTSHAEEIIPKGILLIGKSELLSTETKVCI
jgi:hypothetical protein